MGYKGLEGVTKGYKRLQGLQEDTMGLQRVTTGYKGDRRLQEVTGG